MESKEMLDRVLEGKDFLRDVFLKDKVGDWNLARNLGYYLTELVPEDLGFHLMIARACRHLGDLKRATEELARCKELVPSDPSAGEFLLELEKEERLLSDEISTRTQADSE